jgi:hypothetical protein
MRKTLNIGSTHEQIGLVVDVGDACDRLDVSVPVLGPDPRCDAVAGMQPGVQVGSRVISGGAGGLIGVKVCALATWQQSAATVMTLEAKKRRCRSMGFLTFLMVMSTR